MISSIIIKNLETHIDTVLNDLHSGVNVILGESDEGKSGIIRALKLNSQNRPQGDSYRNDQLDPIKDKKVLCSVGVDYKGDGFILRERNNTSTNHYVIDNGGLNRLEQRKELSLINAMSSEMSLCITDAASLYETNRDRYLEYIINGASYISNNFSWEKSANKYLEKILS